MKFILFSILVSFSFSYANDFNSDDSNMRTAESTFEGDFADVTGINQNAMRSAGITPAANCPACAFAQQLGAHELNAVELGAEPGTYGKEPAKPEASAKEQK